MSASSMTGPDPELGAKISLAGGARKRRVNRAQDAQAYILRYCALYNLTYAMLSI
jgi:hypothetical protein